MISPPVDECECTACQQRRLIQALLDHVKAEDARSAALVDAANKLRDEVENLRATLVKELSRKG